MRKVDKLKIMNYIFLCIRQRKSKKQQMMEVQEHDIDKLYAYDRSPRA